MSRCRKALRSRRQRHLGSFRKKGHVSWVSGLGKKGKRETVGKREMCVSNQDKVMSNQKKNFFFVSSSLQWYASVHLLVIVIVVAVVCSQDGVGSCPILAWCACGLVM